MELLRLPSDWKPAQTDLDCTALAQSYTSAAKFDMAALRLMATSDWSKADMQ